MFINIYDRLDISFAEPSLDFNNIFVNQYNDIVKYKLHETNCAVSIYGKCSEPLIKFFSMRNLDYRTYGKMTFVIYNRPYRIVCVNHDGTISTYRMGTLYNVKDLVNTKINSETVLVDYIFIDDLRYGTNALGTIIFDINKIKNSHCFTINSYLYNDTFKICEYGDNEPSIMFTSTSKHFVEDLFDRIAAYRVSNKRNKRLVVCGDGYPVAIANHEFIGN